MFFCPDGGDASIDRFIIVAFVGADDGVFVLVVIKSLENNYKSVPGLAGATVLGDGSVALILDILGLSQRHSTSTGLANTG